MAETQLEGLLKSRQLDTIHNQINPLILWKRNVFLSERGAKRLKPE